MLPSLYTLNEHKKRTLLSLSLSNTEMRRAFLLALSLKEMMMVSKKGEIRCDSGGEEVLFFLIFF